MSRYHDKFGLKGRRYMAFRKAMLKRAKYRCECCGLSGKLELHHPHKLEDGGDPWDPENIRVLRRECHLKEHRGPLAPEIQAWSDFVRDAFKA